MLVPGSANPLLFHAPAGAAGGYQVERSLRFNSADSAYLSRTPASAGNRKTWTWAAWVKLSGPYDATDDYLFYAYGSGTAQLDYFDLRWQSSAGVLRVGGYNSAWRTTTAVFRDPSAWYHIVLTWDTTQSTAANRIKLYVNGVQQTAFSASSDPSLNDETSVSNTVEHRLGATSNCYLADIHFIDGQALTPSSFTETSATTGQLIPKAYSGSFGTNGFWLKFSDNSNNTASTLGKDYSGNSNNWSPTNLSVTAGAGNDSLVDTPTSYGTDTGAGGEVRGNYCTINPLTSPGSSYLTISNGNLDQLSLVESPSSSKGTIGVRTGKWYWEVRLNTLSNGGVSPRIGICRQSAPALSQANGADEWIIYMTDYPGYGGRGAHNSTLVGSDALFSNGDIGMFALDMDNSKIYFGKNGTWLNSGNPASGTGAFFTDVTGEIFPLINTGYYTSVSCNFGQRPFAYTAPSGFKALCDTSLPAPTIALPSTVMDVKLYTGNGSTQTISGLGFSPDFVWLKQRTNAENHGLFDTVRGAQKSLCSNNANAENATDTNSLTAFTSDGFSLGNTSRFNDNTYAHVAWTWDAGTSNATNTSGSITSTVRANISAGFSVVTYTGTGSNATVGHGLGVAPSFIVIKNRDGLTSWAVYHTSLGATKVIRLNSTNAADTDSTYWNDTSPTSSLFSLGSDSRINANGDKLVAYCWAPVAGYSAFGSYTGNGSSDGPFVYTGFRPRWVMIKRTDSTSYWHLYDTARNTYNTANTNLWANGSDAEISDSAYNVDITSNGFKLRTSDAARNASGGTYVYAAFAEHPFQSSRAR